VCSTNLLQGTLGFVEFGLQFEPSGDGALRFVGTIGQGFLQR
jgi:hypothetical protein